MDGQKKRPESAKRERVRANGGAAVFEPENVLALLLPSPLRGRTAWRWLSSTAADLGLVCLNWFLIGTLRLAFPALFRHPHWFGAVAETPSSLLGIGFLHGTLITLLLYAEGLYTETGDTRGQACILGKSVFWATVLLCLTFGLQGASLATCALFFAAGALHVVALLAWRRVNRKRRGAKSGEARNSLIIGASAAGQRIAAYLRSHPEAGRIMCGFLDDEQPLGDEVLGRLGDLARLARTGFVDELILAAPEDRAATLHVLDEARRLRLDVEIVPELFGCQPAGNEIEQVGDLSVICLHAERLPDVALVTKRLVDLGGAGLALLFLAPVMTLIGALVRLDSPGPALYCAPRVGRKARPFRCFKFRAMVANADELKPQLRGRNGRNGPFFKIPDDPRVTRLGRILRRYSLDELPQLWNVLKGEMSLVGPRPHPLDDFAAYDIGDLARLDVTPGITGLWQVVARRDPSFARGLELDREYIRTWSLVSDLRILLKTVRAVAHGGGD